MAAIWASSLNTLRSPAWRKSTWEAKNVALPTRRSFFAAIYASATDNMVPPTQ
jgi:hypothetical protein